MLLCAQRTWACVRVRVLLQAMVSLWLSEVSFNTLQRSSLPKERKGVLGIVLLCVYACVGLPADDGFSLAFSDLPVSVAMITCLEHECASHAVLPYHVSVHACACVAAHRDCRSAMIGASYRDKLNRIECPR